MVKLNKIYTRTGDNGTTGLVDGSRRAKDDLRLKACGAIDEANAALGLAVFYSRKQPKRHEFADLLQQLQHDLFDLGADLATPPLKEEKQEEGALRIIAAQITRLEAEIDRMNASLAPLHSFVLPGGSAAASYLHLARTLVRRAERAMVALARSEQVNPHALGYVNRLSDLLFVAARLANNDGQNDILWLPGKNRV